MFRIVFSWYTSSMHIEIDQTTNLLGENLTKMGITDIAFDLDDTLIMTQLAFRRKSEQICQILYPGSDPNMIGERTEEFLDIMRKLRPELGIRPEKMIFAVKIMAEMLHTTSDSDYQALAVEAARRFYKSPEFFYPYEQAIQTVNMFTEAGARCHLVTHAEENWTMIKLAGTGLNKFGTISCLDIDIPKAVQWESTFKRIELDPQRVIVIGDNPEADIVPTVKLGATAVHIDNNAMSSSTLPPDIKKHVITVGEIREVIPALLAA